jgi:mono/diheme cytochrome c family protein
MVFALQPYQSAKSIKEMEPAFRDIQAYIKTLQPPTYPFAIDSAKASHGKQIFQEHCAKCHGSYGEKWTYPSKLIDLEEIGTDPSRAQGVTEKARAHYEKTWFAEEVGPDGKRFTTTNEKGYVAPPLDGIWATAPYLHNGSVPTLYHLLNSKTRPARFTRSYQTGEADYDKVNIGWKYQLVETAALPGLHPIEARKIYDTKQPGRGNQGHTFGDDLSEAERWALIEYLKTL